MFLFCYLHNVKGGAAGEQAPHREGWAVVHFYCICDSKEENRKQVPQVLGI